MCVYGRCVVTARPHSGRSGVAHLGCIVGRWLDPWRCPSERALMLLRRRRASVFPHVAIIDGIVSQFVVMVASLERPILAQIV